jgi:hypothetical protein
MKEKGKNVKEWKESFDSRALSNVNLQVVLMDSENPSGDLATLTNLLLMLQV